MKKLFLICLLFVSLGVSAKELESSYIEPDSVVENPSLENTSKLIFHFTYQNLEQFIRLDYSLDGKAAVHKFADYSPLELETTKGSHELQFYLSSDFFEEHVMIAIETGKNYYYTIHFRSSEAEIMLEKPVIYLYPVTKQELNVKVTPRGNFTFTYPEYNNGWSVLASPDGTLEMGNDTYNYLFWESSEKLKPSEINTNEGFIVGGEAVTAFLEDKLRVAGLNGKERADFITFWAPRMVQHERVYVQFQFNKNCDRFATLDIHPEPNNIYRIYMIWQPVDSTSLPPKAQTIPQMDRNGFSVLEWGGQELPQRTPLKSL